MVTFCIKPLAFLEASVGAKFDAKAATFAAIFYDVYSAARYAMRV